MDASVQLESSGATSGPAPANSGGVPLADQSRPPPPGGREGSAACQECGNSAKKDCQFHRCRTCCKSRGFPCTTHVKSTWVPAARRRERQAAEAAATAAGQPLPPRGKRARTTPTSTNETAATSAPSTPQLTGPPGGMHAGGPADLVAATQANALAAKMPLPAEVTAQTLLKSVRVTGVVDGVFEFGYHATVKIGGHIFKGVLYNAGVDTTNSMPPTVTSEEQSTHANLAARAAAGLGQLIDPSSLYGNSGTSLLGGDKQHVAQDLFGGPTLGPLGM